MMNVTIGKTRSAVFGAAIGDAVGVPYEFSSPEQMKLFPVTDMSGGGTYHLPAGTWSDDTTMILCTLDKLDSSLDFDGIMEAFFSWYNDGAYTPFGECFDIGNTTRAALMNYASGADAMSAGRDDDFANGNGSLMRIIPVALYADAHGLGAEEAVKLAHSLSGLTHAHLRAKIGCGIFTCIAMELLKNADVSSVGKGLETAAAIYSAAEYEEERYKYLRLFDPDFGSLPESDIRSSGYVVYTLECAVWCLLNTKSYSDCILKAVNFGNDTDTSACVAGALAGLLYGMEGIPADWLSTLVRGEYIDSIISGFCGMNGIGN